MEDGVHFFAPGLVTGLVLVFVVGFGGGVDGFFSGVLTGGALAAGGGDGLAEAGAAVTAALAGAFF